MKSLLMSCLVCMLARPVHAVLCIAHRGCFAVHHENTLEAIAAAWEAGADVVEVDVRILADHTMVLFHDSKIDTIDVSTLTYARLQAITPDYHVPTLHEALEKGRPGKIMLLDLKSDSPRFLEQLVHILADHDAARCGMMLQSRSSVVLTHLRAKLQKQIPLFYVASLSRQGTLQLPPDPKKLASALVEAGADGISAKGRQFVTQDYIRVFKKKGLRYFVWTINDPARMKHYQSLGVDGIITDDPKGFGVAVNAE